VEHVALLGRWTILVTWTLSNQFTMHAFILLYGIIFGGDSSNSQKICALQKKIVRSVADVKPWTSCRSLSKQLEILPVPCQYILSLMKCIISNQENFQMNSSICNIQGISTIFIPNAVLSCYQKSAFCAGIKVFNSSPQSSRVTR
jgi:hypothetical protein